MPDDSIISGRLRERMWLAQQFWYFWSMLHGVVQTFCGGRFAMIRVLVFSVGLFMICYPVYFTISFYRAGILYVSPALLLMLIAGVIGIGLSRHNGRT